MAILRIPDEARTIVDPEQIKNYLAAIGIEYERWPASSSLNEDASDEAILTQYASEIEQLKQRGNYLAADVINVNPSTPGLESMLAKFNIEHTHDEDEVRYIVAGRGLFHIRPQHGAVVAIEVVAGDLIRVPRDTQHWFNLCSDRCVRAIRLFQNQSGWTPHYTRSGIERGYQPVCLGPAYIPPQENRQ
jgi:1,2-dihydroxy-3-keto-5-methylthiopentene dioxygenase